MRIMRLLVLFDLPTGSKKERRSYTQFRKFLLKDGYHMEQFSVYSRITLSRESAAAHIARLEGNLPSTGVVTVITLTEKQYESRRVLVDSRIHKNPVDLGTQLTLII